MHLRVATWIVRNWKWKYDFWQLPADYFFLFATKYYDTIWKFVWYLNEFHCNFFFINRYSRFNYTKQDVRIKIIVKQQCYGHFILYQSIIQIRGESISDVIVSMLTSGMIDREFELQSSNQRLYLYFCFSSKHAPLTRNLLLKNCIVCFWTIQVA